MSCQCFSGINNWLIFLPMFTRSQYQMNVLNTMWRNSCLCSTGRRNQQWISAAEVVSGREMGLGVERWGQEEHNNYNNVLFTNRGRMSDRLAAGCSSIQALPHLFISLILNCLDWIWTIFWNFSTVYISTNCSAYTHPHTSQDDLLLSEYCIYLTTHMIRQ